MSTGGLKTMQRVSPFRRPFLVTLLSFGWLLPGLTMSVTISGAHQPHDPVDAIAVSPSFAVDQTVFLATDFLSTTLGVYLVLRSSDGGVTWDVLPDLPSYRVSALAISPDYAQDGTVLRGTYGGGLHRTTDGGTTWEGMGSELGSEVVDVSFSPNYPEDNTLLAVNTANRIFKSTEGGDGWIEIASPEITEGIISLIAFSPEYASDNALFAGTTEGALFKTEDDGLSWSPAGPGFPSVAVTALAFSPDFSLDQTILATTFGQGVFISTDKGVTWNASNSGLDDLEVTAIEFSARYAVDSILFVTSATGGIYKSTDGGNSWSKTSAPGRTLSSQTTLHFRALQTAPNVAGGQTLFLGTFEGAWKSTDEGETWEYIEILPTDIVRSIAISPDFASDQTFVLSTYGGGALWSFDGGSTWIPLSIGINNSYTDPIAISPDFTNDMTVFCGTVWGVMRSVSKGFYWHVKKVLNVTAFPRALVLSPDFREDGILYIGTDYHKTPNPTYAFSPDVGRVVSMNGLFVSRDRGETWVPTGLNGVPIHSAAISPDFANDRTLFAASLYTGLYRSTNAGTTWQPLPVTDEEPGIFCISFSPGFKTDRTVFVSAPHSGLFKSEDGGTTWSACASTENLTLLDGVLSPDYVNDQTLFVATLQKGLLKSIDGGASMTQVDMPGNYFTAVAISPSYETDQTVFAACYQGVLKSLDGGSTWDRVSHLTRHEEDRWTSLSYEGDWQLFRVPLISSNQAATSTQASAGVSFRFHGTGVRWVGLRGPQHGIATVSLDGVLQESVDLYATRSYLNQGLWERRGLPWGEHTLTLRVTGERNFLSTGTYVTLDAFDVWDRVIDNP